MEMEVLKSEDGDDSPPKNSKADESLSDSPSSFFDDTGSVAGEIVSEKRISDGNGSSHRPEKKRRLKSEQVKLLEKIFEVENKLVPCRKLQIAREIGLNPRQVAIWFQNRRARSKSKILEKEFDALKSKYDDLKAEYDAVLKENQKLRAEVGGKDRNAPPEETNRPAAAAVKSSSGVIDSESENEGGSSNDESMSFLQPLLCFSEVEEECFAEDLQPNSCNLGFPVQDQGTWLWQ